MDYWEAVILGIVQGVAEFLPISSSGHIVIFSALMREFSGREVSPENNLQMLQMNVALHLGTLISILWVYRADVVKLIASRRLCLLVGLATVPLVIAGLVGYDVVKERMQTPMVKSM